MPRNRSPARRAWLILGRLVNAESPVQLLNAAPYLYLRAMGEPKDNTLRIVVEEATAGPVKPPTWSGDRSAALRKLFRTARPIVSDATCYSYEIAWPSYISYAVRNESFVGPDKTEKYEGRLLRRYSVSKFLDFVANGTFATFDYPGPFAHWEIVTLNHIVDVVSIEEPRVRRFKNP